MLSPYARRASWIRRGSTAGVIGLALAGFTLSYEALHQLAAQHGVPPRLAWAWPLIVDGFIVVASLAVLHAVLEGQKPTYPWVLVLVFSTVSVAFNVVHAPPTPVARLVAAVPPLALVLSFELLMRQVRTALHQDAQATASPRRQHAPPARPSLKPGLPPVRTPRAQSSGTQVTSIASHRKPVTNRDPSSDLTRRARELIRDREARGEKITGAVLATELGISDGYGRRLLRQHTAEAHERSPAEAVR